MSKLKSVLLWTLAVVGISAAIASIDPLLNTKPAPRPSAFADTPGAMRADTWLVKTPTGSGSAVHFISTRALPQLLTAAHVVDDLATNARVSLQQWRRGPGGYFACYSVAARVVWVNLTNDVALLEAATTEGFGPGVAFGPSAQVGDRIRHVGYYFGTDIGEGYTEGLVMALDVRAQLPGWPWKGPLDLMNLSGLSGCSGGPIFNSRGECIGILVGGVNSALMVFVPVRQILPLLKRSSIVRKTG